MKRKQLKLRSNFQVVLGNQRSQATEMVLAPGKTEGGAGNRHRGADQWLLVMAGTGRAKVNRRSYPLKAGTLMLSFDPTGKTPVLRNTVLDSATERPGSADSICRETTSTFHFRSVN